MDKKALRNAVGVLAFTVLAEIILAGAGVIHIMVRWGALDFGNSVVPLWIAIVLPPILGVIEYTSEAALRNGD